nr:adenosine deaminase [Caldimonas sp.]
QWSAIAPLLAPGASPEALVGKLCEVRGIGPWTAHYVAMRGLGWPDAFPPGDVAAAKAMRTLFGSASARDVSLRAERWRPWRAYALLRLWNSLGATP